MCGNKSTASSISVKKPTPPQFMANTGIFIFETIYNKVPSPPSEITTSPLNSSIGTPVKPTILAVSDSNSKSSTSPTTFVRIFSILGCFGFATIENFTFPHRIDIIKVALNGES